VPLSKTDLFNKYETDFSTAVEPPFSIKLKFVGLKATFREGEGVGGWFRGERLNLYVPPFAKDAKDGAPGQRRLLSSRQEWAKTRYR